MAMLLQSYMFQLGEDTIAAAAVEVLEIDKQLTEKLSTIEQEADDFTGCDHARLISFMDTKFDKWLKTEGLNEIDTEADSRARFDADFYMPNAVHFYTSMFFGFRKCTTQY